MTRRTLLQWPLSAAAFAPKHKYRVALIGNSANGGYGHDWDLAWRGVPNVEVIAVADPVEPGRRKAMERAGAAQGFADYREMLVKAKPDIVTVCPRTLVERVAMVTAAAEAKAHILMEKPFARTLAEADRMCAATGKAGVRVQVGHTARLVGVTVAARRLVEAGEIGVLQELRGRGKEDKRAGGEDLMVLGTHVFDLMRYFAADPQWVFAHVTEQGRELQPSLMREASEPIGPVGGDDVAAMFGFSSGVHGYFGSKHNDRRDGRRFGLTLYGSKGLLFVPLNDVPSSEPHLLRAPAWAPEKGEAWERIPYPPGTRLVTRPETNRLMALDLLAAIEQDRAPACSAVDGRWTIEMVAGVYQSQFAARRVPFPLATR